ncbi:MAG: flagellar hook-basal body complex protein [Paracoccaceae bacterium]
MDNSIAYITLNRQRGLRFQLDIIANNVANIDTSGFRREGILFSEYVIAKTNAESVSMADLNSRFVSSEAGELYGSNGNLDIAIEGDGYFAIDAENEVLLTRSGSFQRSETGFLVTSTGSRVLDIGQAPIFLPPNGSQIEIANDGTVSVDGLEQAQIGIFSGEAVETAPSRVGNTAFSIAGAPIPLEGARLRQGALEGSNIKAIEEIAQMIEVTRAYERAENLMRDTDERVRRTVEILGQAI